MSVMSLLHNGELHHYCTIAYHAVMSLCVDGKLGLALMNTTLGTIRCHAVFGPQLQPVAPSEVARTEPDQPDIQLFHITACDCCYAYSEIQ